MEHLLNLIYKKKKRFYFDNEIYKIYLVAVFVIIVCSVEYMVVMVVRDELKQHVEQNHLQLQQYLHHQYDNNVGDDEYCHPPVVI